MKTSRLMLPLFGKNNSRYLKVKRSLLICISSSQNLLGVGWRMWESIKDFYEYIVHGKTEISKKPEQLNENIEPYLQRFIETQKSFLEPFLK